LLGPPLAPLQLEYFLKLKIHFLTSVPLLSITQKQGQNAEQEEEERGFSALRKMSDGGGLGGISPSITTATAKCLLCLPSWRW